MQRGFTRLGVLPVEEVLPHIAAALTPGQRHEFMGQSVSVASLRLRCFATKGTKCVCCGIEGTFFALERAANQLHCHINLYATGPGGVEVLMTRDHINPQARGGGNSMANSQTMCFPCNQKKGCDVVESTSCSSSQPSSPYC